MKLDLVLIAVHVVANLCWIGSIVAVGVAVMADKIDPKIRGELATKVYKTVAVPAFVVSFLGGMGRLLMDPTFYFKQTHFMHMKLLFAVIVIALHHVIGAKAKKLAAGEVEDAGKTGTLLAVFLISAAVATFNVILRLPK